MPARPAEAKVIGDSGGPGRFYSISPSAPQRLPTLATVLAVVAILYFARDVLLPLAIAVLLTFALAPLASRLRRLGLPRVLSVSVTVAMAFSFLIVFGLVVATQVAEVAQNIPAYQGNIISKIRTFQEGGADNVVIRRLTAVAESVSREINEPEPEPDDLTGTEDADPILVEVFVPNRPIETLARLIGLLMGPIGALGLIIVVVIFMLLEREELRDRFIRLAGYGDLHRTTEALQEAGTRVGQYLLMQLVVNFTYGVPLAFGLWLVGIPNAILWGMLAIVLRFVPYIGPVISTVLPLFLAFAVDPGWGLVIWVAGIFLVLELVSNNVIEPWLYGSRTGLSPLAIIVSAIFWAWLWGPVGLVLSTPLTVCLTVLGRYVPQFEFLDVLFGSEPVLDPKERLYQRLLAGDPDEATDHAEEILEEEYLADYYGKVAVPALLLAERDRRRGVLTAEQMQDLAGTARALVSNLEEIALEEEEEEVEPSGEDGEPPEDDFPDGTGKSVLCIGGRGPLDDASAVMLAQVLQVEGAGVSVADHTGTGPQRIRDLVQDPPDAIVICFLNHDSIKAASILVRRLKRRLPATKVGVAFWTDGEGAQTAGPPEADFVASNVDEAVRSALSDAAPSPLATTRKALIRRNVFRGRVSSHESE